MKGTVKWYDTRRGYGFIIGENGQEVYVHRVALPLGIDLNAHDQVEYETEKSERGPLAIHVKKISTT